MEALTCGQKHLLFLQKVHTELFVVGNVKLLNVDLREAIERARRLHHGKTRNVIDHTVYEFTLFENASAGNQKLLRRLISAEAGLYNHLSRNIGAKSHVGKHVQAVDVALHIILSSGKHHPTDTIAGNSV